MLRNYIGRSLFLSTLKQETTEIRISSDIEGISPAPCHDPFTLAAEQIDCFVGAIYNDPGIGEKVFGLDPHWMAEDISFREDFYPALLDASRNGSELYGLPLFSETYVIYYNADLLVRRGLELPKNDWTLEYFMHLAASAASLAEQGRS